MSAATDKKIEAFFSKFPLRSYPKGQILIHAGDEPERIFYIKSGRVRQYDISYRGDEVVLNVFKDGAFFPMLWAMTKLPNRNFFAAEEVIEVNIAPKKDTLDFLKDNPDVIYDLLRRLYVGVDGMLGRMAHLMAGSAQSRLLYELIVECKRFGEIANDGSCLISISEGDLASRAGLSRETVSREMQKIIRDKLVNVSHSGILVKSITELENRLGTEL